MVQIGGAHRRLIQRPISEILAEELRKRIWKKEYEFGQRLLEADLAEELEVSRSSLREALRILEVEKLVTTKSRKGTFVTNFTNKDIDEINEIRILLEIPALMQAIDNIKESDVLQLESMMKDIRLALDNEEWYEVFNIDMNFHSYLVNLCNNKRIIETYNMLLVQIRTIITFSHDYYEDRKELYYQRHIEMLDVIKSRDKENIRITAEKHIDFMSQ